MERYTAVMALALRLIRGEVVELVDEHGRGWRATSTALSVVLPDERQAGPVLLDADTYDVAVTLLARATCGPA
jgi:hypothetical protein